MQCVPTGTVDKLAGAANATAAATIVIDEIGYQVDITASASTSSGHLLLMMMVMILIAAAATTAVVTFPFIERKVRLGLVESVLQLGDASPTFTTTASFRLLLLRLLMMMVVAYCCCLWRWDLWLFLVLLLLLRVMVMVILVVAAITVPQVFFPDVVLVEIEFVLFVVVVVLVRGYVPILRIAAVLGADRPRGRFVVELDAALLLLLLLVIGRRVRD